MLGKCSTTELHTQSLGETFDKLLRLKTIIAKGKDRRKISTSESGLENNLELQKSVISRNILLLGKENSLQVITIQSRLELP